MSYPYYICDVFTQTLFGGNQLAVFPNAQGLSSSHMQQIAREFNFSETTFVLPAKQQGDFEIKIFTPTHELPFAGHPNIGTAFVLEHIGAINSNHASFEQGAGLVKLSLTHNLDQVYIELQSPQELTIKQTLATDIMAQALSLHQTDILTDTHPPQVASVGLPFIFCEIKTPDALSNIKLNHAACKKIADLGIAPQLHVYAFDPSSANTIHARVFVPALGVDEDPATGSANAALAGLLASCNNGQETSIHNTIYQGAAIQRPSTLYTRVEKHAQGITSIHIGGYCALFSKGSLIR